MKAFLVAALITSGIMFACNCEAQVVQVGKVNGITAPACTTEADMIAVAKADSEGGIPKALEAFKANPNCDVAKAMMNVKRVVFSAKTERGATVRVLEVEAEGMKFYIMVDVEVVGFTST